MARRSPLTVEIALYLVIALVAVLLRFGSLGILPLNEGEAAAALPAYALAQGPAAEIGAQPAYTLLTSVLFSILPSSEFAARVWPAFFGVLLVMLPYTWRDVLGRKVALVMAAGLALDPGLVALSRLASGHMLALAASTAALSAWRSQPSQLAGGMLGLSLLAAPTVMIGLFAALLMWAFFINVPRSFGPAWKQAGLAALAVLILGSTLLLSVPSGLGSALQPLTQFVAGWVQPSGVSVVKGLFALFGYGLPLLLFAVWGLVAAWREAAGTARFFGLFALISLAIIVIYPGRQMADLAWVVVPLWGLAAQAIGRYLFVPSEEPRAAWGQAGLMFVFFSFLAMALVRIPATAVLPEVSRLYMLSAGGVVLLALLASVLVAQGWSRAAALHGLAWTLGLFLGLFMLAGATRPASTAALRSAELWAPGPAAGQLDLLRSSLQDLSNFDTGQPGMLSVDLRVDSAALRWLVRELPAAAPQTQAKLIITSADDELPLEASAYQGQSFVLHSTPDWQHVPPNVLTWLLYRQAPEMRQHIILWAVSGLLPQDVAANSSGESR